MPDENVPAFRRFVSYDPSLFTFTNAAKNIAFGSFAGVVSEILEYPFDLAKVRLQSQVLSAGGGSEPRFNGTWDCLTRAWRNEGFCGLYRGLPVPIAGSMAETATIFVSYSAFQDVIRVYHGMKRSDSLSIPQLTLAAAGAGFTASYIITPIELVKCKMQVQMMNIRLRGSDQTIPLPSTSSIAAKRTLPTPAISPEHAPTLHFVSKEASISDPSQARRRVPGAFRIIRSTIQTDGFTGLWRGHTGTILRDTGGSAAWFGIKEVVGNALVKCRLGKEGIETPDGVLLKAADDDSSLLPWESAISGGLAGAFCALSFYPVDTVKSAMQTEDVMRQPNPRQPSPSCIVVASTKKTARTFTGTFWRMYTTRGLRGLYAGCGVTVVRAIPSSGIVFVIYDGLASWLG